MAKTVKIGLSKFYMGPVAVDGDMGTVLESIPFHVEGTPVLTTEEGEQTDFNIEDSDAPYYTQRTQGNQVLTTSVYGVSAEMLALHFGGTYTPGAGSGDPDIWEAPLQIPEKEASIVAEHKDGGGYLEIRRAKVNAVLQWKFQKSGLPQVDLTITVLTPTKEGVKPLKFVDGGTYTPA